jgi:hypothetical protein
MGSAWCEGGATGPCAKGGELGRPERGRGQYCAGTALAEIIGRPFGRPTAPPWLGAEGRGMSGAFELASAVAQRPTVPPVAWRRHMHRAHRPNFCT